MSAEGGWSEEKSWPRISLVTAVYNGEKYLETTIQSVLGQGYPNLEYIIVNDGSTDETAGIIRRYEPQISGRVDQPNQGLYAALNAGFARTTGEIMGWLNASDLLHTNGLFTVAGAFMRFPEVRWITGRPSTFGPQGWPGTAKELRRWSRYRFLAGANRHIQQESTYWRRDLWDQSGGALSTEYRVEGDFELWVRFFRHAKLYTVDALIGGWRDHADSLSHVNEERYDQNCQKILDRELATMIARRESAALCRFISFVTRTRFVRGIWSRTAVRAMYNWRAPDWPPLIEYRRNQWEMVR